MRELMASGKVAPVIDRCFGLSEVPEAIRYLAEGHARGKVVITLEAVHGVPGVRRLRDGDIVKLDVTMEKDGFMADAGCHRRGGTNLCPP